MFYSLKYLYSVSLDYECIRISVISMMTPRSLQSDLQDACN